MIVIRFKNLSSPRLKVFAGLLLSSILGLAGFKAVAPADAEKTTPQQEQQQAANQAAKPKPRHHWYQLGRASWYGKAFQGRETASGETYNMYDMTCAHRSLPLGSLIRVTNLRNHKSVVVRVNDRGPVPESRVVDLSYSAATFLGFQSHGLAPVRLDLIKQGNNARVSNGDVAQLNWPATVPQH